MTTSSAGSSSSARPLAARMECTTPPDRFTGVTTPWKPPSTRFASTARPRPSGPVEAPTTATDAGASTGRSDATAPRWSRSAMRASTASLGWMSSDTVTSPKALSRRTSKPARLNTPSMARLSLITSASKR
jgi:hypothetical protein